MHRSREFSLYRSTFGPRKITSTQNVIVQIPNTIVLTIVGRFYIIVIGIERRGVFVDIGRFSLQPGLVDPLDIYFSYGSTVAAGQIILLQELLCVSWSDNKRQ
jgi:hypothetical protein